MSLELFLSKCFVKEDDEPLANGILSTKGNDACARIQAAVKSHFDIGRLLNVKCSCSGDVYCGSTDLGGIDIHSCFWHICLNCYEAKYFEQRIVREIQTSSEFNECPYCGY